MRLLHVYELRFQEFAEGHAPPYVVTSHRWLDVSEEATFKDVRKGKGKEKRGYKKI